MCIISCMYNFITLPSLLATREWPTFRQVFFLIFTVAQVVAYSYFCHPSAQNPNPKSATLVYKISRGRFGCFSENPGYPRCPIWIIIIILIILITQSKSRTTSSASFSASSSSTSFRSGGTLEQPQFWRIRSTPQRRAGGTAEIDFVQKWIRCTKELWNVTACYGYVWPLLVYYDSQWINHTQPV